MRIDYSDGSFMLAWQKCRAWYNPDGTIRDAEYKRKYHGMTRYFAVNKKHHKVLAWIEKQGKQEIALINAGILKRVV